MRPKDKFVFIAGCAFALGLMLYACWYNVGEAAVKPANLKSNEPVQIDKMFRRAYEAMGEPKKFIVKSNAPADLDAFFGRAFRDVPAVKTFILKTNSAADINRAFARLFEVIP